MCFKLHLSQIYVLSLNTNYTTWKIPQQSRNVTLQSLIKLKGEHLFTWTLNHNWLSSGKTVFPTGFPFRTFKSRSDLFWQCLTHYKCWGISFTLWLTWQWYVWGLSFKFTCVLVHKPFGQVCLLFCLGTCETGFNQLLPVSACTPNSIRNTLYHLSRSR